MNNILLRLIGIGLPAVTLLLLAFFKGKQSGLKKADKEIESFKTYAEEKIREANNKAAKTEAENRKLTLEKESVREVTAIVTRETHNNNQQLKESIVKAADKSALKSAISDLVADSIKKAEEARNR